MTARALSHAPVRPSSSGGRGSKGRRREGNVHFVQFAAGLGEFKIRDLNDEINKLLREKGHWQDRIKELGGPDYWV